MTGAGVKERSLRTYLCFSVTYRVRGSHSPSSPRDDEHSGRTCAPPHVEPIKCKANDYDRDSPAPMSKALRCG